MFVFFALSGFLITGLLLEERATTGRVSLAKFFARRALRLLPALVFFLGVWVAVVLATGGHAPWTTTVPGGTAARERHPGPRARARRPPWSTSRTGPTSAAGSRRLRPAGPPVVSRGGGAVLPSLVACRRRCSWPPEPRRRRLGGGTGRAASFVDVALRGGSRDLARGRHGHRHARRRLPRRRRVGRGVVTAAAVAPGGPRARGSRRRGRRLVVLAWGSWVFDQTSPPRVFAGTWVAVSLAAGLLVVAFLGDDALAGLVGSPARQLRRSALLWPLPVALRVAHLARRHGTDRRAARARRPLRARAESCRGGSSSARPSVVEAPIYGGAGHPRPTASTGRSHPGARPCPERGLTGHDPNATTAGRAAAHSGGLLALPVVLLVVGLVAVPRAVSPDPRRRRVEAAAPARRSLASLWHSQCSRASYVSIRSVFQ